MGVAPSRETIRRGFFNVNQANPSSGGGSGGGNNKRQDIVLIPLTKEYFPSPDCPLFVQFHKARCDAAVNYYFRRPGNPGDLSCIPNYESSYLMPGEETRAQRRRRRQLAREARAAATAVAGDEAQMSEEDDGEADDASDEDDSFPSREALYRGVIEHVEEALFDTDAEMRQAYQWALAHPHTTMGPDGRKQRKVLPVLCAVAFRSDVSKVHGASHGAAGAAGAARPPSGAASAAGAPPSHMSSSSIAMNNMQAALENGVYMFGSIINIVGCFGFVSMQEDVDDAQRMSHHAGSPGAMSPPLLTPGSQPSPSPAVAGTYHHDPYSFTSSQASSGSHKAAMAASGGTLLSARGAGKKGGRHLAQVGSAADLITLPPPVAAPLAAMVFLTKSAGEQNLGRVTHIAASTYYYQMIQAGLIERQPGVRMEGPNVYPSPTTATAPPPLPPYGSGAPPPPPTYSAAPMTAVPSPPGMAAAPLSSPTSQGPPRPFLPPMETFSFSSLLTNIPVLSFLYEMKWRWGYLGVLKAGTPAAGTSRNSSFNGSLSNHPMSGTSARGPGSMMGNHSTGGLAAADRSVGQGVTDELEMWITVDQMIHGRVSKDLAQRLCWSLAERPEVMQERISQLPSEESGYWRYRGLADQTRLPPIPEPGKVVTIHPKDVYVMGSDVLPGFNEGDILRFDAERMVWFADHSIPLEGLVLAAMRPYCKQAREAVPEDPSWMTKVCDAEEAEALQAGETDAVYPTPAPTAEERAALAADPSLVHIHEHVGNFYVYRFVRDGTSYYHGTVPNFANPNKKRQVPSAAAATHAAPAAVPAVSPPAAGGGGGSEGVLPTAPTADGATCTSPSVAAKAAAATATGNSNSSSSSKPSVPVPKTIASALFSLLPASRATVEGTGHNAATTTTATAGGNTTGNGMSTGLSGSAATTTANAAGGAGAAAAAPQPASTTYLATPVTSNAITTARRWVQALYSYAYGAPTAAAGGRRGPTAASLSSGAAPRAPVPPLRSVAGDAGGMGAGGSYPSTPVHGAHGSAKTPTSAGAGAMGFPAAAAFDVAVWPTPRQLGGGGGHPAMAASMGSGSYASAGLRSPGTPQLAGHHSRSSSHSLLRQTSGQPGEEGTATVASKPLKRYVEGGSYEWDWRKQ